MRTFIFCTAVVFLCSSAVIAGPHGTVQVPSVADGTITIDGSFSDWPLGSYTTPSRQPVFPEGKESLDGTDALVIFTDWDKFRTPDFDVIADKLSQKLIFDGRNMYDPKLLARRGFTYFCVGRPTLKPA